MKNNKKLPFIYELLYKWGLSYLCNKAHSKDKARVFFLLPLLLFLLFPFFLFLEFVQGEQFIQRASSVPNQPIVRELLAQEPIIEEEGERKEDGKSEALDLGSWDYFWKEIWEKNVNLDMGFSRTFGHENSFRQLTFVSLDFRRKVFPWLKMHLGGRYSYEEIQFKIRVERKASPDPEKQVETYTKNIELLHNKWDRFLLQDAAL